MRFRFGNLLENTQRKLRNEPARTQITVSVKSQQRDGFQSAVTVRNFTVTVDQPAGFGGTNMGPKPSEYVLVALASCQEITYRLYADALGIEVNSISVKLEGRQDLRGFLSLDKNIRPGFQEIRGTVEIDSPATAEDLRRLKDLVDRHCPVLDDLRAPVPVSIELHVEHTRAD